MIKPLVLGNRTFPVNIIQGPLAGVSCSPFRRLTWQYSQPAFSCTEMISCKTLIYQENDAVSRFVKKDPQEGPVCFQLSGSDPTELAEAVKRATGLGADLIDLNCGCPVKKIRSKGAGSRLLTDPVKLFHLIRAMKENTPVPVSVKIRVEGRSQEKFNQDIAQAVQEGGADYLIVHGRHYTEHYDVPCHHDQIAFFVENMTIPVIGNGDIACVDSLKTMLATGCAGVMITRAGVGQPWLIGKLIADIQNRTFALPAHPEIGAVFLEHVKELSALLGNEKFAILQARKFAKYYGRTIEHRREFCEEVNTCERIVDLTLIVNKFFGTS